MQHEKSSCDTNIDPNFSPLTTAGLYFCFVKLSDQNIFVILYGLTSVYFAVSFSGTHSKTTVFARSDAAATIYFITQFCAASNREQRLLNLVLLAKTFCNCKGFEKSQFYKINE